MDIAGDLSVHVVADQLANGGGEIEVHRVDVLCNEAVLQGPVSCLAYPGGFFVQAEVIQQHGGGEDTAQGVGDVLACGLGVGTVYGFEEGGSFTDGGRGEQAQ